MTTVSAPTPLLNYTLRYNMLKDAMELSKVRDIATDQNLEKEKILKAQSTTIRVGYEPILHCYAIRQVIKILNINNKKNSRNITIDDDCLRNGDSANVIFKFKYNPQYLKIGSRFILCEGKTKVMGEVTNIL